MTGVILVLAANTAFNGFPVLGSILAQDGLAPRALGSRGDRLAYSNGIVFLAVMAIALILAFNAETTRLIQLYIVGVFVSFNLSQLGHDPALDPAPEDRDDPVARRRMYRSRAINTFGLAMTSVVFVIVLITKFLAGAWIAILAMVVFFVIMRGIRRHYDRVAEELVVGRRGPGACRPGCTRSCWSPSCTSRRCGRSPSPRRPGRTSSRRCTSPPTQDHRPAAGGVGRAAHRRAAEGALLAVPRDHPADRPVRRGDP